MAGQTNPFGNMPPAPGGGNWRTQQRPAHRVKSGSSKGMIIGLCVGGGVLVLAIVAVVAVLLVSSLSRAIEQQNDLAALGAETEELARRARQALDSGDYAGASSPDMQGWTQAMQRVANKYQGSDASALAQAGLAIAREMEQASAPYDRALEAFEQSGSIDPRGITSTRDIDKRIQVCQQLLDEVEKLDGITRQLPERFRAHLEASSLDAQKTEEVMRGFNDTIKMNVLSRIRDTDRRICNNAMDMLRLLRSQFGEWHYSESDGGIVFYSQAVLTTYNRYYNEVMNAIREQESLQRQFYSGF